MKTSKLLSNIKILIIALALSVGMSYAFADWTTPKSVAPTCVTDPANSSYDGGCLSPINIGSQSQAKLGPLTISAGDFRVANGKIGVGTLNPVFSVDVAKPSTWGRPSIGGSSPDNSKWFYMLIPGDSSASADIVRSNNTNLRIFTETARGGGTVKAQVVVTGDGKVGIGTSNPAQTLDVNGKTKTSELEVSRDVKVKEDLDVDGTVTIRGGVPGPGKVLTSDGDGNASWQAPAAGPREQFSFGGIYMVVGDWSTNRGRCAVVNPATGSCACPVGYGSGYLSDPYGGYYDAYYCYKIN
ncbi:MAG: hypothetical protein A3G59_01425 [Candidatus Taylorbacteria bacterium RIFCSPLOWO2_12_FULL_47_20]|uniref:Uncharacterized protein n=2 Tax=Candidatus Tayloriibacteriota TaxID=1817919 RepID=A0A1G2P4W9_9BACT|nr:MAG: hypothetical protein A3H68_02615 [Candidatus Taylorbacteria bacterium RIFCSPLOWO2_02_FULL_46_40]OHA43395.1 MAG: hypothetical protein A3G59_01425 [Candidatus Taylorbacteria bacterium RIFCSPLOWO2_12_FULL_47_20]